MSDHVRENIFVQMKFILQTILDIETRRRTYKHISNFYKAFDSIFLARVRLTEQKLFVN